MLYDAESGNLSITAGGDAMITRKLSVHKEEKFLDLIELFRSSDVGYVNLEMLMHDFEHSPGSAGGTFTGSDPSNLAELTWSGINLVSTANNHSHDYGEGGVLTNLKHLKTSALTHAGTGQHLSQARSAGYLDTHNGRVALIAAASTFAESGRALNQRPDLKGRPGLNPQRFKTTYIVDKESFDQLRRANRLLGLEQKRDFQRGFRSAGLIPEDTETEFSFLENRFMVGDSFSENTELNKEDLNENLKWISDAKRMSDWVIVSFHCHESGKTIAEPPKFLIDFAHECIDAGASVFIGHGPHVTRGIEIYKGAPILYSLGNFIFQNDTVKWQPSYNYDQIGLDHYFTPADFYDKRSDEGKRGFPADPIYWQSVVAQIKFENGNLSSLDVVPIDMGYGKPRSMTGRPLIASGKTANQALSRIKELSEDMGTDVSIDGTRGIVTI